MSMRGSPKQAWATSGTIFAATIFVLVGIFQILMGIAAVVRRGSFIAVDTNTANNYLYYSSGTTWGWIHLGVGIVVLLAGLYLYTGQTWARAIGIAIAVASAVVNFFVLPYYPIWSILIIALDVFVIWAIASAPRAAMTGWADDEREMGSSYAGEGGMQGSDRWRNENAPAGRHYATDTKEGAKSAEDEAAEQEQANAGRRGNNPGQSGQQGQRGS